MVICSPICTFHRRHSSTDGLPEPETVEDSSPLPFGQNNPVIDSTRMAKTSTWPLKQHNPRIPNQPPMFFAQGSSDCPVISSPEASLWNTSSIVGPGGHFSPSMDNAEMEKYTLFGKSNWVICNLVFLRHVFKWLPSDVIWRNIIELLILRVHSARTCNCLNWLWRSSTFIL